MFDTRYAETALTFLRQHGIRVDRGLTQVELAAVEAAVERPLPPDLRLLLHVGLLVGEGFPAWRQHPDTVMQRARAWIREAFLFDIEHSGWWARAWGPRPLDLEAATEMATHKLGRAPPLVPVCAHRFLPTEPPAAGNPVLSLWQAVDTIYYGYDLADYLYREFGVPKPLWSATAPRPIPFWGELLFSDD